MEGYEKGKDSIIKVVKKEDEGNKKKKDYFGAGTE